MTYSIQYCDQKTVCRMVSYLLSVYKSRSNVMVSVMRSIILEASVYIYILRYKYQQSSDELHNK